MPYAPIYSTEDYLQALEKLLPRGPVWQVDPNSIQAKTERGLVAAWWRVNVADYNLLVDAFPATAVGLLPEWEATLGLPDPCAGPAPTIAARQQQVVAKLTNAGGQSPQYYIDFAQALGYEITITSSAPFRAGQSHAGDPLAGADAFYTWTVHAPLTSAQYFRAGLAHAGEPLQTWGNEVLECAIEAAAPAHTVVIFTYGSDIPEGFGADFTTGTFYSRPVGGAPTAFATLADMFTFTRASTGTYRDAAGVMRTAAINAPRIECAGDGSLQGLLMEDTRQNFALQSQALDDPAWNNNNAASAGPNAAIAPDGTLTADKIIESTANDNHFLGQVVNVTNGVTYTFSMFFKAAERTFGAFQLGAALNGGSNVFFDLSTGAVVGTFGSPIVNIERWGNGWWRVCVTRAATATSGVAIRAWSVGDGGVSPYLGDGTSGIYAWGFMAEIGPAASSYAPTTTVAVTRAADACIRTLGGELNGLAGTVVVEGTAMPSQHPTNAQRVWALYDIASGDGERIHLARTNAADLARFAVADASIGQAILDFTFVNNAPFKSAVAWALNDFAHSFNGAVPLTDNAGTLPLINRCELGSFTGTQQMNGHIKKFTYYPTRKSNAELQALAA